ncbi:sugar transferase [Streptomyces sp. ISL-11]|uniref:sugar transferase n=1 Tax=Streptomyces sp. ISL-11 TaxID=2819174 RepID=UPI001BE5CD8C|nr:sugar transferase [Streptomyces sp. ISL-11]MBT2382996.1 sugar transferase [Streptomyces sp. ISL-11]
MSTYGDEGVDEGFDESVGKPIDGNIRDLLTPLNRYALVSDPVKGEADRRLKEFKDAFDAGLAAEISDGAVERKLLEIKIEAARRAVVRDHKSGSAGLQEFLSLTGCVGGAAARGGRPAPLPEAARKGSLRRWWCYLGLGLLLVGMAALAVVALPGNGVPRWGQAVIHSAGLGVIVSTTLFTVIQLRDLREHRPDSLHPEALSQLREEAAPRSGPPVPRSPKTPMRRSKRALDLAVGATLLWSALPMLAIVSLWIRFTSRGPVLVRHPRVGAGGRVFQLYDFRTRDRSGQLTRLGTFLQELGLETLPRLWNLFRGDVTLLGPPAEHPAMAASYPKQCRWVFSYRPGIAGPLWDGYVRPDADLLPGSDAWRHYLDVVVPQRVMVDRAFYDSLSAWGTACLIFRMLFSSNAFTTYRAPEQESEHGPEQGPESGTAGIPAVPELAPDTSPLPRWEAPEARCLVNITVWQ